MCLFPVVQPLMVNNGRFRHRRRTAIFTNCYLAMVLKE